MSSTKKKNRKSNNNKNIEKQDLGNDKIIDDISDTKSDNNNEYKCMSFTYNLYTTGK